MYRHAISLRFLKLLQQINEVKSRNIFSPCGVMHYLRFITYGNVTHINQASFISILRAKTSGPWSPGLQTTVKT